MTWAPLGGGVAGVSSVMSRERQGTLASDVLRKRTAVPHQCQDRYTQPEAVDNQGGSASQDRSRRQEASYAGVRGFQEKARDEEIPRVCLMLLQVRPFLPELKLC